MRKGLTMKRLFAGLMASAAAFPALAQETRQGLDEITVTAERREGTLQDTPISISAVTGDTLERSSIYDTEALSYSVPGLNVQRDVVGKAVIRGVGTENFTVGGDPGVAVYNDGAYMARTSTAIFDFFDIDRIEVLRGPQGTLYGRNAVGGVINVLSNAPTEEFEVRGNFTYGNYDAIRAEGAVSGPIADGVRARIAGLYSKRDGFTQNIFPGLESRGLDELDTKDLWALRGRLDIDLASNVTLELIGDIYRDDSNPPAFWYTDATLPWQSPSSVYPRDLRTVSQGYETVTPGVTDLVVGQANRQDQTGGTARLTWEADGFTVTSTSAYRDTKFDWINDGDGLSDFLVVYFQKDRSDNFTQDLQIASNGDGPFQWIVGGFFLTEDSDGVYAIPLGPAFGNATIVYDGTNKTDAFGVFAEGKYSFGAVTLTAGLRYSDEQKDATLDFAFASAAAPGPLANSVLVSYDQSADFNALTPRFVIDYQATESTMLYASVTRGFKSGGFSLLDNPLNSFNEEFIWSYEIGTKSRLFDNRFELNTSAFYYDYRDQQLSQVTSLATQTTNAGSSTVWGIEADFKALLTDNFQIDGNFAYLNTEFDEFCTNDTRDLTRPIDTANCPGTPNLAGNKLPRAPEIQVNLAAMYTHDFGSNLEGFARVEWQHTGDQFFSVFNRPTIAQDAFNVFNASIGVSSDDGRWSVRGWARNLFDEEYFSNLFESGVSTTAAVPQGFVAPPRTYGVTLGFKY